MKVLIVGFGNIGFRHAQSILANPLVEKLVVYDNSLNAAVESRWSEIESQADQSISLKFAHEFSDIASELHFDFAVSATPATDRLKVVEIVRSVIECRCWILEKPVINSTEDLPILSKLSSDDNIYVNHHRRFQPDYLSLAQRISGVKYIKISSSELGLLCNFSHHVDLAKMLCGDGCRLTDAVFHRFGLMRAKRPGFFEARGVVNYFLTNGVECLASTEVGNDDQVVEVTTDDGVFVVNETVGTLTSPSGEKKRFEMLLQSQLTGKYVGQYAEKGEVSLTKLRDIVQDYTVFLHSWEEQLKNGRRLRLFPEEQILFT